MRENKLKCLLFVLSVALLIAVLTRGDDGRGLAITSQPGAERRTHALLASIPQHGSVLGYHKAPVTLQFFGDLQCKESRQVMLGALPFLIRRYVRDGELQIRFRSRETDTKRAGGRPEFIAQQTAALAAGEQGKLWDFIDVFYRDQGPEFTGYVNEEFLDQIAQQARVRLEEWSAARAVPQSWVPQLEADAELASAKRLDNTPSFLIGPTGGVARPLLHFGLEEPKVFEEAVQGLL